MPDARSGRSILADLARQMFDAPHHHRVWQEHRLANSVDTKWLLSIEYIGTGIRAREHSKRCWVKSSPQFPQHVLDAANLRRKVVRHEQMFHDCCRLLMARTRSPH